MKNFLFSLLIMLMVMSSLACAMPTCTDKIESSSATQLKQPCADHYSNSQDSKKNDNKVNFLLDCMGVDLQKTDYASFNAPDLKVDFIVYASLTDVLTNQFINFDSNAIRGSPLRSDTSVIGLSVYQTTQRFRL